MKGSGIYFVGFVVLLIGLLAALWKFGVLERIGAVWTLIGVVIALGIGIMLAAAIGSKKTLQIDK